MRQIEALKPKAAVFAGACLARAAGGLMGQPHDPMSDIINDVSANALSIIW